MQTPPAPHWPLVTHSTQTPLTMSQKPVVAEQSASFAQAAPHVCDTEQIGVGAAQSIAARQSTHACVLGSQRWGAWQSPSTLHSTQTPALQTPPTILH